MVFDEGMLDLWVHEGVLYLVWLLKKCFALCLLEHFPYVARCPIVSVERLLVPDIDHTRMNNFLICQTSDLGNAIKHGQSSKQCH